MGNEDSNASGKVIKERTVKKRAARSIVAPKADEEIVSRDARRRDAFAAMNSNKKPVTERDSQVIRSPGTMKVREEGDKSARTVTAPIQLTWNEDTPGPAYAAPRKKMQATGWPERPPVPRMTAPLPDLKEELKAETFADRRYTPEAVREKQNEAPKVRPMKEGPQQGMQGQQRTIAGSSRKDQKKDASAGTEQPQTADTSKQEAAAQQPEQQLTQNTPGPELKEQRPPQNAPVPQQPVQNSQVPPERREQPPEAQQHNAGSYGQPHSNVSGLSSVKDVSGGNTTVWNPVEGVAVPRSMRDPDPVNPAGAVTSRYDTDTIIDEQGYRGQRKILKTTVVTTTTTTTYEAVNDEDLREIAAPPATAVTETVTQPGVPVRRQQGPPPRRPGRRPVSRQGQPPRQRQLPQQGQPPRQRPVPQQGMQGQPQWQGQPQVQNGQPYQNTMQPSNRPQQPYGRTRPMPNQPAPNNKPVSAMDKQLADIEKALGLTQDTGMGTVTGSIPAPEANGQQPVQPQAPTATPTPTPGNNNNNNDNKQPLNEDVFKGIDTFSKGASFESPDSKKQKNKSTEYTLLAIEAVVFVVILCICVSIYSKIKKDGFSTDTEAPSGEVTEILDSEDDMTMTTGTDGLEVQEAGAGDEIIADIGTDTDPAAGTEPAPTSDSIDVENENFSLKCTNVTVVLDANNNPAALIYFTFVNKTSKLLSMSEVFPPSVTQNGEPCETFASLDEYPEEFYNKDTQISDGTSIDCCYSVSLKDAISPIRLTIHDNYETFSDVGTTEIPLQ